MDFKRLIGVDGLLKNWNKITYFKYFYFFEITCSWCFSLGSNLFLVSSNPLVCCAGVSKRDAGTANREPCLVPYRKSWVSSRVWQDKNELRYLFLYDFICNLVYTNTYSLQSKGVYHLVLLAWMNCLFNYTQCIGKCFICLRN